MIFTSRFSILPTVKYTITTPIPFMKTQLWGYTHCILSNLYLFLEPFIWVSQLKAEEMPSRIAGSIFNSVEYVIVR